MRAGWLVFARITDWLSQSIIHIFSGKTRPSAGIKVPPLGDRAQDDINIFSVDRKVIRGRHGSYVILLTGSVLLDGPVMLHLEKMPISTFRSSLLG